MAPELQELLRSAAAEPAEPFDMGDVQRRGRRLRRARYGGAVVGGLAVLLVVTVAAGTIFKVVDRSSVEFADQPPGDQREGNPDSGRPPEMWQELPPAPIVPRTNPVAVWTGDEMLVWGGQDPKNGFRSLSDGAAYNPETRRWRVLATPLVVPKGTSVGVWTGREMLVWSAYQQMGDGGAAYDPVTDSWRLLPAAPIEAQAGASAVWTGSEMLVWGGQSQEGDGVPLGAAFNPRTNEWRRFTDDSPSPISGRANHGAVWTGTEMIVWGGTAGEGAEAKHFADGAAYNPDLGRWRLLAPSPLGPREPAAMFSTGKHVVVAGGWVGDGEYSTELASYDPRRDRWRKWLDIHIPERVAYAWAGDHIITWGSPGKVVAVDKGSSTMALGAAPVRMGFDGAAVSAGEQLIFWSGLGWDDTPIDAGAVLDTRAYPLWGQIDWGTPGSDGEPWGPAGHGGQNAAPMPPLWPVGTDHGFPTPSAAAIAFAREMLGWPEARFERYDSDRKGSVDGALVDPGGWMLNVRLYRFGDGRYGVFGVHVPDTPERPVSVSVTDRRIRAETQWVFPGDAVSAELVVKADGGTLTQTVDGPPASFDSELPEEMTGKLSVFVLFRDADGKVIATQSTDYVPPEPE